MAKKTISNLEPKLESRIKVLKKFMNDNPESNYINNGFYTNKNIYIKDNELSNIPNEYKVLKSDYKKLLNVSEIENKFIPDFKKHKYMKKEITLSDFKKMYTDLKRFGFEQIKIRDGKFMLYDSTGHSKWKMRGECEILKGFNLDFDYKQFLNICYAINELKPIDIKFFSSGTYLVVKMTAGGTVMIYARGIVLEQVEQKTLV